MIETLLIKLVSLLKNENPRIGQVNRTDLLSTDSYLYESLEFLMRKNIVMKYFSSKFRVTMESELTYNLYEPTFICITGFCLLFSPDSLCTCFSFLWGVRHVDMCEVNFHPINWEKNCFVDNFDRTVVLTKQMRNIHNYRNTRTLKQPQQILFIN